MGEQKHNLLARYVPDKAFRHVKHPSYLYASGNIYRCNPAGVACVCFGEGPEIARAEFDSYYNNPLTELGFYGRVKLSAIPSRRR